MPRGEGVPAAPAAERAREPRQAAPAPPAAERTREPRQAAPAAEPRSGTAPPVRPFPWKEDPLFSAPGNFVSPGDFTLGELLTGRETDPRSREVGELFRLFFSDLREGISPQERIHPDYRPFLLRSLEGFSGGKKAVSGVRIGTIRFSRGGPETAVADVLLRGPVGRARGRIVADRRDGVWYVSALTMDLDDLTRPGEPFPPGSFDPGPDTAFF